MAYRGTLQADALKLVAKKLQSSLAVEGELPEDGLAAFGDDGDDIMLALARKIVNGEEEEQDESVEEAFAQARDTEAVSEELLVDEGWHAVEVEPEVLEVHRNGAAVTVEAGRPTVTRRPLGPSVRCSPGRSSWPRSRQSRPGKTGSQSPQPCPCSSGR